MRAGAGGRSTTRSQDGVEDACKARRGRASRSGIAPSAIARGAKKQGSKALLFDVDVVGVVVIWAGGGALSTTGLA